MLDLDRFAKTTYRAKLVNMDSIIIDVIMEIPSPSHLEFRPHWGSIPKS